jgi:hypothetical protein
MQLPESNEIMAATFIMNASFDKIAKDISENINWYKGSKRNKIAEALDDYFMQHINMQKICAKTNYYNAESYDKLIDKLSNVL